MSPLCSRINSRSVCSIQSKEIGTFLLFAQIAHRQQIATAQPQPTFCSSLGCQNDLRDLQYYTRSTVQGSGRHTQDINTPDPHPHSVLPLVVSTSTSSSSAILPGFYQSSLCVSEHPHMHIAHLAPRQRRDTFADIEFYTRRQNTVQQKPIRAGCELLLRGLHKGQSLRVALGEDCGMEKCGQPLLLSCHWPCVIQDDSSLTYASSEMYPALHRESLTHPVSCSTFLWA